MDLALPSTSSSTRCPDTTDCATAMPAARPPAGPSVSENESALEDMEDPAGAEEEEAAALMRHAARISAACAREGLACVAKHGPEASRICGSNAH